MKIVKLIVAIFATIFFTIIFMIGFFYYNNLINNGSNNNIVINKREIKINESINVEDRTNNQKNIIKIKKNDGNGQKKQINTKNINKTKKQKEIKNNININLNLKKIHYYLQDREAFYFLIKFINRLFFVLKKGRDIYIINFKKENVKINIRDNYKNKINSIYDKFDLGIIKNDKKEIDGKDCLIKSFLSRFLALDEQDITANDLIEILQLRPYYKYPLYGKIDLDFKINRILYINSLYNENILFIKQINKNLYSDENNILFVNFTKFETDFFKNFFLPRFLNNKNYYDIYIINVTSLKDFLIYLFKTKFEFYLNNRKDKKIQKEIIKLKKGNKLIRTLFYAYYRQIKNKKFYPFVIKVLIQEGNSYYMIPLEDKNKVKSIINYIINNILVFK